MTELGQAILKTLGWCAGAYLSENKDAWASVKSVKFCIHLFIPADATEDEILQELRVLYKQGLVKFKKQNDVNLFTLSIIKTE